MRPVLSEDVAVYCQDPPEIEFHDDGMVHVVYRVGTIIFRAVMRPSTLAQGIKRANTVSDEIAERRVIVPIDRRRRK